MARPTFRPTLEEVFEENPKPIKMVTKKQKIASQRKNLRIKAEALINDVDSDKTLPKIEYPLPTVYGELAKIDTHVPVDRRHLYNVLSRLSPYLIQRLVYESANLNNAPRDRIHAAQILIDKIMPNLSAEQLSIDAKDIQSLVIVRSGDSTQSRVEPTEQRVDGDRGVPPESSED